ncbi:MAG: biotin--[acetyl-CoA-carboxylase] ligase [Clostridiales bacterium]|nr:biotin--[acetyl-CoA-carboxylase] ligase [Clostridiales bacterium]
MMRAKIIRLLMQNPSEFVSGQEMADQLSISRAAVNKHIDKLRQMGCDILCKPNAGYRLNGLCDLLLPELVEVYRFSPQEAPYEIVHFDSLSSTNQKAKELALKGAEHGTVVVCEEQTEGRGRQGRQWLSKRGEGIYCSIILRPSVPPEQVHQFALMAGVAVARAISALGMLGNVGLKWPNDVLCGSRKISGILCEMSADPDGVEYLVLGIGINVKQQEFPRELWGIATSMAMETGRSCVRPQLLAMILTEFFDLYQEAMVKVSFEPMLREYVDWSVCVGKQVTVSSHRSRISGRCLGFGPDGALVLRDQEGKMHSVLAGDVSVRGDGMYV